MAFDKLNKVMTDMDLDIADKHVPGSMDTMLDHSGLVVIPFWIIMQGLNSGCMNVDSSVDVPMRNANIIEAFLEDIRSLRWGDVIKSMALGVLPYAFILNTKEWDKSGAYYLAPGQSKVRLKTKSKTKPNGYLVTLVDSKCGEKPGPNEVDGANFLGANYIMKKSPFRLNNQYQWTPNNSSGTRRFTVDDINKLLK